MFPLGSAAPLFILMLLGGAFVADVDVGVGVGVGVRVFVMLGLSERIWLK